MSRIRKQSFKTSSTGSINKSIAGQLGCGKEGRREREREKERALDI